MMTNKIQKLATGLFVIITCRTPRFVDSKPENLIFQGFILDEDEKFLYISIDKHSINQIIPKVSIAGIELYSEEDVEIVLMKEFTSVLENINTDDLTPEVLELIEQQIEDILPASKSSTKTSKKDGGMH